MKEIAKFGKLKLLRPDPNNWEVSDGETSRYYATLPSAMTAIARLTADKFSSSPKEWLEEYSRMVKRIEKAAKQIEGNR